MTPNRDATYPEPGDHAGQRLLDQAHQLDLVVRDQCTSSDIERRLEYIGRLLDQCPGRIEEALGTLPDILRGCPSADAVNANGEDIRVQPFDQYVLMLLRTYEDALQIDMGENLRALAASASTSGGLADLAHYENLSDHSLRHLAMLAAGLCRTVARASRFAPVARSAPERSGLQLKILKTLKGQALDKVGLANSVGVEPNKLYRSSAGDGLSALTKEGVVKNDRLIGGYYRPDAPPPEIS